MRKARWFTIFLVLGVLLPVLTVPAGGEANRTDARAAGETTASPALGPYLDIWSGDGVDNWGSTAAYSSPHDEYLVAWTNQRAMGSDIYARRVGGDGSIRSWFAVVGAPGESYARPAVAYSPVQDRYLVAYEHTVGPGNVDIWATLVNWSGAWMSAPFTVTQQVERQQNPAVAYNRQDDEFLVVYENEWAGGLSDIAAQRVRAGDGALLSWRNIATVPSPGMTDLRTYPAVTYNPARNEYLITYTFQPVDIYHDGDVYGKVTSGSMANLSEEIHICDSAVSQLWTSSVAAGPDEYMVTWVDRLGSPDLDDVYARRLNGAGTPQGSMCGFPIAVGVGYQMHPTVSFGAGYGYLLVWRYVHGTPDAWDVYGRYVMPGRDTPSGDPFLVSNTPSFDAGEDVSCSIVGNCLVVMDNYVAGATDYEIQGRMVMLHRIYLPLAVRNN